MKILIILAAIFSFTQVAWAAPSCWTTAGGSYCCNTKKGVVCQDSHGDRSLVGGTADPYGNNGTGNAIR